MQSIDIIQAIVADQLGAEINDLDPALDIVNDIGADSLDITEIIIAIETQFDVHLDEDVWHTARTIHSMADLVDKHRG